MKLLNPDDEAPENKPCFFSRPYWSAKSAASLRLLVKDFEGVGVMAASFDFLLSLFSGWKKKAASHPVYDMSPARS